MELDFNFYTISVAIVKLFLLMATGYILYDRKLVSAEFVDILSLTIVRVIFPALIISKTVSRFSFAEYPFWWTLPLCAMLFSIVSGALGSAVHFLLGRGRGSKEFVASCAFQNAGYLPMNLILFSFAGAAADTLLIYLFLFILGFNVFMWSLLPLFLSGQLRRGFAFKKLLNPPVVATVIALLWVAVLGKGSMPPVILDPMSQLGQASFPLAMLTLGAYLRRYRGFDPESKTVLAGCLLSKLMIFPAIVLAIALWAPVSTDYKFFLFLEAVMPTAVSLVVIGGYTGADNRFFSGVIFYSHLAAIFTIPLWLALFHRLGG